MKKSNNKSLSLNKLVISRLNDLTSIKGGSFVQGGGGGTPTSVETTRISQFPMICDPNSGTLHCETRNTDNGEGEN